MVARLSSLNHRSAYWDLTHGTINFSNNLLLLLLLLLHHLDVYCRTKKKPQNIKLSGSHEALFLRRLSAEGSDMTSTSNRGLSGHSSPVIASPVRSPPCKQDVATIDDVTRYTSRPTFTLFLSVTVWVSLSLCPILCVQNGYSLLKGICYLKKIWVSLRCMKVQNADHMN